MQHLLVAATTVGLESELGVHSHKISEISLSGLIVGLFEIFLASGLGLDFLETGVLFSLSLSWPSSSMMPVLYSDSLSDSDSEFDSLSGSDSDSEDRKSVV